MKRYHIRRKEDQGGQTLVYNIQAANPAAALLEGAQMLGMDTNPLTQTYTLTLEAVPQFDLRDTHAEAIAQADAFATNAGLPSYSHLLRLWLDSPELQTSDTPPTRRVEVISYTLGEHFAPFVEYGDTEGLTTGEIEDFNHLDRAARREVVDGCTFSHWAIDTDDRIEFTICEATGLQGACLRFDAVYFHPQG